MRALMRILLAPCDPRRSIDKAYPHTSRTQIVDAMGFAEGAAGSERRIDKREQRNHQVRLGFAACRGAGGWRRGRRAFDRRGGGRTLQPLAQLASGVY